MKHFYLLLLFFCTSWLSAQGSVNWQLLNPKPSKSNGIDIVMSSPTQIIYITDKEIIKTTDGGEIWSIKKQISSAKDLDVKNNIGLVVGSFGNIFLSTDTGEIWNKLTVNSQEDFIYCKINSDNNLLAASSKKLYFSADGGGTWSQRAIPFVNVKTVLFLDDLAGFVGTNDGKIYKTIDGGVNWVLKSSVNVIPSDIFTLYFFNASIGFAERGHGELLKTTDAGDTWIKTSTLGDKIYAFSFVSENIGFAAGDNGVIFKTVDGGNTWTDKFFQYGRIYQTSMFGIHFISENVGFSVGQRGRIIKTQNSGDDWNQYAPFYNDVSTINKVDGVLFAKVGLDIYKSVNDGGDWTILNRPNEFLTPNPFTILQYSRKIKFITKDIGYIIGGTYNTDSRLFKTIDGGTTWTVKKQFNVAGLNDLTFVNENVGFVCGGQGTMTKGIFKTIDGGTTWTQLISDQLFGKITAINENLVFASTYSSLYKSTDGGLTWNLILNDDNQQISDFNFTDESNGYVIGNGSFKLEKTTDGGSNWTTVEIPNQSYNLVRFKTKNIGLIANEYGVIYRTFNAGRSWETDSQSYAAYDLLYSGEEIYLSGQYGNIFKGSFQNIPNYVIKTDEVTEFGSKTAKFSGSAASNFSVITDLKFMYSKAASFTNSVIVDVNNPVVNANDSNGLFADINNLEPNTKYYVRVTGKVNGNTVTGNTINFTTKSSYNLVIYDTYTPLATKKNLSGQGSANGSQLSNIKFQYSTDNVSFDQSSDSVPASIAQGSSNINLNSSLQNLEPATTYFARICADYENEKVYSNVVTFTTAKEYSLILDEVNLNYSSIPFSASVYANNKEITNLVFEYGTSEYDNFIAANPSQVLSEQADFVSAEVLKSSLNPVKNYKVRLKGFTNGKTAYSNTVLFRIDKSLVFAKNKSEYVTDSEVKITGLIKSYNYSPLSDISIEYGKTVDLGTSKLCTPSYKNGTSTFSVSANLNQLESQTQYYCRFSAMQDGVKYYSDLFQFNTSQLAVSNPNRIKFQLFPNPVNDELYFEGSEKIAKIEIYDLSGKLVVAKAALDIRSLKVDKLLRGTFVIKIYSESEVYTSKFIKN
ncbi:YCF48-related protein [Kaistella jeonii]|uniref:T9SS type A sorting domain-containing protein n=1 Tax=Kaistella jeonii TaxID=266749 RepID=A0A0C1FAL9_9FLAO|nr:YCF48-related protein [Kaistella jeonii]KIA90162.1 hypothetical protein OA86_06135 [Kaistella jeonii]SFB76891.1 Por secretion system C-terminal sorting domain-containing protein [Kaistella jeonii]VEI96450.1 Ycf48-like protein [Kaistella jeonii]